MQIRKTNKNTSYIRRVDYATLLTPVYFFIYDVDHLYKLKVVEIRWCFFVKIKSFYMKTGVLSTFYDGFLQFGIFYMENDNLGYKIPFHT